MGSNYFYGAVETVYSTALVNAGKLGVMLAQTGVSSADIKVPILFLGGCFLLRSAILYKKYSLSI